MINRIDERLNPALPHLATKAELGDLRTELVAALADKPGRSIWRQRSACCSSPMRRGWPPCRSSPSWCSEPPL
jgi:hypothetical protein